MSTLRLFKIFMLFGVFVTGVVSSCTVCSCSPAGEYGSYNLFNSLSIRVINQAEPVASVQMIKVALTFDDKDDQSELLNFDDSQDVISIIDDTPHYIQSDEICLEFESYDCQLNVSTFAIKITFSDGREVFYAGWNELIQPAPEYETFGLGYVRINQESTNLLTHSTLIEQQVENTPLRIMMIITQSEHVSFFAEKSL